MNNEQERAIINICLGNSEDYNVEWSRALDYVKLLRNRYNDIVNKYKNSMPIDLNKETEYAYQAYLEESHGINEKGIALPKYYELPELDRQRFMAMTEFLITKFMSRKEFTVKTDNAEINVTEQRIAKRNTPKPELKLKSKSKSKFRSAR